MPNPIHILNEKTNPPNAYVWTVLCGEQCFSWDDGTTDPASFDFILLGHGHEKATCCKCITVLQTAGYLIRRANDA